MTYSANLKKNEDPSCKSLKDAMNDFIHSFDPAKKRIETELKKKPLKIAKVKQTLVEADKVIGKSKGFVAKAKPYLKSE